MDENDAIVLLQKKLSVSADGPDAAELVQVLDCMPLAITQAAAFINQRTPRMTILRYLDGFRNSDEDRAKLLKNDLGDSRRDGRASNSIISTWQISFEHIRYEVPSAARLLSLMSFFDRQGIPEDLLQGWYGQEAGVEADTDAQFEDDIHTLTSYSLVRSSADGSEFEMHRLVQFSTRKWLELSNEQENWKERYVALMDSRYPTGVYENWTVCGPLFPHAQAAVECQPAYANANAHLKWASLLYKAAWYAREMGLYEISLRMDVAALEARKNILGQEHFETLESMSHIGVVLWRQGKKTAAKEMHQQTLEGREKLLGKEHGDTLGSAGNLALVLTDLREYEAAEQIYWRLLQVYEQTLGKDHPHALRTIHNLAVGLHCRGKYAKAEQTYQQALQKREEVLGKEHPDTLETLGNLAETLYSQDKYEAAEQLAHRAVQGKEKILGKEHPNTLLSMNILARILRKQGKYETAELLARRALEGNEKVLGKNHNQTVKIVHTLAVLFHIQHRYKDSLPFYERAKSGYEHALGLEHPSTINCSKNYSLLLQAMERSEQIH